MIVKKIILGLLLAAAIVKSNAMNKDSTEFRIISTKAGIEYLERSGLTINDESEYQIQSNSGLVYILPNKEVMLLPTNFDPEYPGIIFKDLATFKQYAKQNYFPIGDEHTTWFERFNHEIKHFREKPAFYADALKAPGLSVPFKTDADVRTAFQKLQSWLDSAKRGSFTFEQLHAVSSMALEVINYLVDYKGYKLQFREGYENYNPVTEVLVEKNGQVKDVIATCISFSEIKSPDAANAFMKLLDLQ